MSLKTVEELLAFQKEGDRASDFVEKTGEVKFWGDDNIPEIIKAKGKLLGEDNFTSLAGWHHEGIGELTQPEPGLMQINCLGSGQGNAGCMAFFRQDFPDNICLEYKMKALSKGGLLINFIAFAAREAGKDPLTDLPKREGIFSDYILNEGIRCYHVSISRYQDNGEHTGVSNWRRNPGIFMMSQGADLCEKINTWYDIAVIKQGRLLQMTVDGKLAGGFIDADEIPEPLPTGGKIGFRAIGSDVRVQIKDFKVIAL